MFKISLKLKDSFKYTNNSKITGMFIIKAHLFAFLVPFSSAWQHDGNRCSQINERKMTSNHPHFSCIDVSASTVPQKMRNSNLFQKITDTSYETDYLTCKSRGWFRTVTVLVCPRFWASAPACVPRCACACVPVLAEACEWQAVSERDVIIWLMSVRVVSRARVTSLAASWHGGQETLLYDFPTRGNRSCHSRRSRCPISFCGYSTMIHKKEVQDTHNNMKETHLWTVYLVLFLQQLFFKLIYLLCSEGLEEGSVSPPSCPYPLTSSV